MQKCPGVESNQAGKADSCKGCPNAKICATSKPDDDILIIKERLSGFNLIISVLSGKGGVGKSTVTRNLAASLSQKGLNTLILDFDLSGPSIPRMTNTQDEFIYRSDSIFKPIKIDNKLSVISIGHLEHFDEEIQVFNSNVKNYAIKKILKLCDFSDFDVMVIDTPPNITEEHLALVNYIKPHCSVMVTTPQKLSLNDVRRQVSFCKKVNIEIVGLIENMCKFTCPNCNSEKIINKEPIVKDFCDLENLRYLGAIPLISEIARKSDNGEQVLLKIFENTADILVEKYYKEKILS